MSTKTPEKRLIKNEGKGEMYLLWAQAWLRLRLACLPSTDKLVSLSFAFYFTVPLLFKAFRELKLPTKQGESGKEGETRGREARRTDTWNPTWIPQVHKQSLAGWRERQRWGTGHECLLTDVLRCCYFTESFTPAKQITSLSTPFLRSTPQHFSVCIHLSLTESASSFFHFVWWFLWSIKYYLNLILI